MLAPTSKTTDTGIRRRNWTRLDSKVGVTNHLDIKMTQGVMYDAHPRRRIVTLRLLSIIPVSHWLAPERPGNAKPNTKGVRGVARCQIPCPNGPLAPRN
jgi:hypothetical protein